MNVRIRTLSECEVAILQDFLYEAIYIPKGQPTVSRDILKLPELRVYIENFGYKKDDHCLVLEVQGNIVGAVWTRIMNDYGHIDNQTPSLAISIYKDYRGQGLGTKLMEEMLALLKQKGYEAVSLSVQKENPAFCLYERLGFCILQEHGDEYLMMKEVS